MLNVPVLQIVVFLIFFVFFKYAQKNSTMHETSPIVVVIIVLK